MSHLGERLSALIDSELNHAQRERVLAHLARCEPCRREAVALRALKRRMLALGEATVTSNLADRLIALSAPAGPIGPPTRRRRWPGAGRRNQPGPTRGQWAVRSLAGAALAVLGLAIPAAAFLAGGNQQEPGPSVTPAVDVFIMQHVIKTGEMPAQEPTVAAARAAQGSPGTGAAGAGPAATAASVPPVTNASAGPASHPGGATHPGRSLSPPARCGIGGATVRRSPGTATARCALGAPLMRHAAGSASWMGGRAR